MNAASRSSIDCMLSLIAREANHGASESWQLFDMGIVLASGFAARLLRDKVTMEFTSEALNLAKKSGDRRMYECHFAPMSGK